MKYTIRYIICMGLGITMGLSVSLFSQEHTKQYPTHFSYLLLQDVLATVEAYYVENLTQEELVQAALKGVFEQLDPYSKFLNSQQLLELKDINRGEYFGFGFEVAIEQDYINVIAPFPDSPAARAGIVAGDKIIKLNNITAVKGNLSELLDEIKRHSMSNKSIQLVMQHHNSDQYFNVILQPSHITIESVTTAMLDHQIGYVKLSSFQENSTKDLEQALAQWSDNSLEGLIIDLRNNPGGLLDQAVQIADLFLAKGRIVSTSGRFFDANSDYYASPKMILKNIPMLVLINKGSASAAEVLAAALQQNGRAKLLGENSFGKGTVQSLIPVLHNGSAIKLTVAQYNTPKGDNIHNIGIMPDIEVIATSDATSLSAPAMDERADNIDFSKDKVVNSAIAWMRHNN